MLKEKQKGLAIISTIIVSLALYTFVILLVLIFLMLFEYNVEMEIKEQYLWNKIQEVPLDLLSMTLDGESFVSRMNKVYYKKADESQLRDKINDTLIKQLFYLYGEYTEYPFIAVIKINGISITEYMVGCYVDERDCTGTVKIFCVCYCSDECGPNRDKMVGAALQGECKKYIDECLYTTGTRVEYSAEFPFPLTFNGTDKFVDELSYDAVEYK